MPVLEAMACGTPVITSNTSSLPEVAGDAGELVDPADVEALTESLVGVLSDPARAERMAQAGRKRAQLFTWRAAAEACVGAYRAAGAAP